MVSGRLDWRSINPISLFGFGLLSAVLLGLNGSLAASLSTALLVLGLFYIGQSILRHFHEAHAFDEEKDNHLPLGLNLLLLAILTFGLYVVLRPYAVLFLRFSVPTLVQMMNAGGWFFYPKLVADIVLFLVFAKHWLVVLIGDVLQVGKTLEHISDVEPVAEAPVTQEHHEEQSKYNVKKILVTLD